jgi:hypothetical protein
LDSSRPTPPGFAFMAVRPLPVQGHAHHRKMQSRLQTKALQHVDATLLPNGIVKIQAGAKTQTQPGPGLWCASAASCHMPWLYVHLCSCSFYTTKSVSQACGEVLQLARARRLPERRAAAQLVGSRASALLANCALQHQLSESASHSSTTLSKPASSKAAIQHATSPVGHKALVRVTSTGIWTSDKRLAGQLLALALTLQAMSTLPRSRLEQRRGGGPLGSGAAETVWGLASGAQRPATGAAPPACCRRLGWAPAKRMETAGAAAGQARAASAWPLCPLWRAQATAGGAAVGQLAPHRAPRSRQCGCCPCTEGLRCPLAAEPGVAGGR